MPERIQGLRERVDSLAAAYDAGDAPHALAIDLAATTNELLQRVRTNLSTIPTIEELTAIRTELGGPDPDDEDPAVVAIRLTAYADLVELDTATGLYVAKAGV